MDQERANPVGILITTSRNPPPFLRRANKVLVFSIPNSQKINRGSLSLKQLFSYCWNLKISRLLILQKKGKSEIVTIKAYFIEEKVQSTEIALEISDLIFLRKHDKRTRIQIDDLNLQFENNVDLKMKKTILTLFKPILGRETSHQSNKKLYIKFRSENATSVIGTAVQQNNETTLPLYTLRITKISNSKG